MTPSERVDDWLDREGSHPAFELKELSLEDARRVFQRRDPLLTVEAPSGAFAEVTRGLRPFIQTRIDDLIRIEELAISNNLQDVLDQGLYNPHLSNLFENLWSARFQYAERQDTQAVVEALIKATFEERSVALRCDSLLFWLTLMSQNYPVSSGQLNLIIQGPEDDELTLFLLMSEAWSTQGCPLKILILS
jgi:hypothetical protein